ncbi:MAG: hypothetical protein ACUVTP_11165 [Candidatus Fervidibacter sp.]|uniref:hypothetical protein n=1 Tax=Candidatus Fervidibacter sp. TaxID=3100871 RepID=UPI00404A2B8F
MGLLMIVDLLLLTLTLLALWYGVRLHSLLRAGELGKAWQFVVFGVVLLALREILRLSNQITFIPGVALMERVAESGFMVMLCYALWRQWSAFEFLQGRQRKQVQWNLIAKSLEGLNGRPISQEEVQEAVEKEWREQWHHGP